MKILLAAVNAKYIHSNLAVYSLKAVTRNYGEQIEIGEYTINQQMDDILSDIYRKQPEVVAFSCYIWNITKTLELCGIIKRKHGCEIVLGGPEVAYRPKDVLEKYEFADFVLSGEGEWTFPDFLDNLKVNKKRRLWILVGE